MNLTPALEASATALERNADELTRLDALTGDGDLGRTALRIATALRAAAATGETDAHALLLEAGKLVAIGAASSCGTLVGTGLMAAGKADAEGDGQAQLAAGLSAAAEAIQKRGKSAVGDRSLLDALAAAAAAATASGLSPADYSSGIVSAVNAGAAATSDMVPRIGRARAHPEQAKGNPDAGAVLIAVALSAALDSAATTARPDRH